MAKERLQSGIIQRVPFCCEMETWQKLGFALVGVILHESAVPELYQYKTVVISEHLSFFGVSPVGDLTPEHLNPNFSLNSTSKGINVITS